MRAVLVALVALASGCGACKDTPAPAKRDEPAPLERAPAPAGPRPALELPAVKGPGLVPAVGLGPNVTLSKSELSIDGESIAPVSPDGSIDPARVQALVRTLETKANNDAPVGITLDATVRYRRVGQLLDTLKRAGFRNLGLLAGTQMIPIELPDSSEVNRVGLRPVVTIDDGNVLLWSASAQEGTRAKPKLSFRLGASGSFAPLTTALAEIVQRRWPDGKREAADKTIIIQPDANLSAQELLQALAAVRSDGSRELFPDIFLAGGN